MELTPHFLCEYVKNWYEKMRSEIKFVYYASSTNAECGRPTLENRVQKVNFNGHLRALGRP